MEARSQKMVSAALCSLWRPWKGRSLPCLSVASGGRGQSLAFLACSCTALSSSSLVTWSSSLCVCVSVCLCLSLFRTLIQNGLIRLHLKIPSFQIREHSQVLGLGVEHIWGREGDTIQSTRVPTMKSIYLLSLKSTDTIEFKIQNASNLY